MKNIILKYVLKRLMETSTLRGLVILFGTLIGYHFSGAQTDNIIYIILGIVGLIGSVLPDSIGKIVEDAVHEKVKTDDKPDDNPKPTPPKEIEEPSSGWGDK